MLGHLSDSCSCTAAVFIQKTKKWKWSLSIHVHEVLLSKSGRHNVRCFTPRRSRPTSNVVVLPWVKKCSRVVIFMGGPAVTQFSGSTTSLRGWTSHIGPVLQRDRSDRISEFLSSHWSRRVGCSCWSLHSGFLQWHQQHDGWSDV